MTSKTPPEELVSETASEFVTFLSRGAINERQLSEKLDFADLEIDDFRRLKRVHFVLSEPVVKFIQQLPQRIRQINKETQRSQTISRGEIEGRIDWGATTKLRNTQSYGNKTLFVCNTPYSEYDIPENLVLKKLLGIIYETVTEDIKRIDYDWRMDRWDEDLVRDMERIFERNIHLSRIKDHDEIRINPRTLNAARTSRDRLYTQAYDLFNKYQQLQADEFDDEEVSSLLSETLVEPNDVPTLFELFGVFKLIGVVRRAFDVGLQPIQDTSEAIARMESETTRVEVYHDTSGDLAFSESIDDVEPPMPEYLRRYREMLDEHVQAAKESIDRDVGRNLFDGRPDLLIEVYDTSGDADSLTELLIGEMKYTNSEQTFTDGLKELLEYLKYAREGANAQGYLQDQMDTLRGVLVVDSVDFDQPSNEEISVIDTEMLRGEPELPE
ncbi:hypothetical protein [Halolamina rubra]|uniref:hypothetical protein n=1 Tax=Halolamina rubra TaxID=1380430 RepID=UPI0006787E86|nr:hypothetical protein [Halolamina rubra]